MPGACRRLGATSLIPADADVANAIGAVASQVIVAETLHIRPGEFGGYVLFGAAERREFARLEPAREAAGDAVVELVRAKARAFGTDEQQVRVEVIRHVGRLRDGSTQLLELEVRGRLAGAPAFGRKAVVSGHT